MNRDEAQTQTEQYWVGIDWGTEEHAVSIVDDHRTVMASFKVEASLEALHDLASRLHALPNVAGIAIESTRNPIVPFLMSHEFTLYCINPKMSSHWREGSSVAGIKNDARDGLILALELSRRHESLRVYKNDAPANAELSGLCTKHRDLIDQRTALVQRLKATIRQYYPAAVGFFSDWASPTAWRFLNKYPDGASLARARKSELIKFLKANRIGLKPQWLDRIDRRKKAADWPVPNDAIALQATAIATVAQLLALQPHIKKMESLIDERAKHNPHVQLMQTLPGAGKRLAPALAAIAGSVLDEEDRLQALRGLAGTAPVEVQSGKRRRIKIRRRCNKHWRNILHLFSQCSLTCCAWAKAYYKLCKQRGDRHAAALRKLADKWLKIINRMIATGEAYDEDKYLDALRLSGSPVYDRLCGKTCG